jgi:predicted membrane-bound mannosyltransferase
MPGIGDGIWQGLYYWLQQQEVARGGQPWYYYFMLIPLYEQIGVVFACVGIVRCLRRPSYLRLFLVYWFIGNLFIYTWAGEKMPWLMIHLTMPMMVLAALGLEPAVTLLWNVVKARVAQAKTSVNQAGDSLVPVPQLQASRSHLAGAITTVFLAGLLLLPTLQNMFQVTFVHYADAPHEMMIYVQTSTDINIVMSKIETLDKKYYGGNHTIPIGVTDNVTWPFAWYLRDYTSVCYRFPSGCADTAKDVRVMIGGEEDVPGMQSQYGSTYAFHQYHLRTQWDQGYMPPPCIRSKSDSCSDPQPYTGVGPWLWLSYGDNPPPHAKFDLGRAVNNIWQWWWERKAFGSTDGTYDMGLFIRSDMGVKP